MEYKMKILVTGSGGFIAKNLIAKLNTLEKYQIYEFNEETELSDLGEFCQSADFVFHLAGVNRPKNTSEFMAGNYGFTSLLLETLKKHGNKCPIMISSSIQAELNNPYGLSKRAAEEVVFQYGQEVGTRVLVYRFPNVFGKWCRPNYNSVIATFCHNITHDLPIIVNDPSVVLQLVYIDDVVNELVAALAGNENRVENFCEVLVVYTKTLGEIINLLEDFKSSRDNRFIPDMSDEFTKKLYATYLSYLPICKFSYPLKMNIDTRGSFTEFIKTPERGQISVNISKLGITKGNHWHNTKNEKFLVVSGKALIRFRRIDDKEIIEYIVSDEMFEVVEIPVGYVHNITNIGNCDLITIMWANEAYNPDQPDTYFLEV